MARTIAIYTDSASDITPQELQSWQVRLVPMSLTCGEDAFTDDHSVPMSRLWERMEAGEQVSTSQPSLQAFLDVFERAREHDRAVVLITLSANLSGTYQTARAARTMVDYDDIYIVDGRKAAASSAEKMLVWKACKLRDEGVLTAAQIAQELEALRSRVRLLACLNTLEYLVRGGRLSKVAGSVGTVLNIKPIISFSDEGGVQVIKKTPGLKRATSELCAMVGSARIDRAYPVIPIFAKESDNCQTFLEQLRSTKGIGTAAQPQEIGATIGCHIGPGGFGLVYVEAEA